MKTLIAIPCMDMMHTEFVKSLIYMEKGENVNVCFRQNSLIYESRNLLAITAIKENFDYVLWLDSDMAFPTNTLKTLRNDLETIQDCDMVTGLYVKRRDSIQPVLYSRVNPPEKDENGIPRCGIVDYVSYPKGKVFPAAGCGFGCVMTKVSLLKEVFDKFGPGFSPLPWTGEDISFCYRVNQLGKGRIWCDSTISCGHVGQKIYTENDMRGDNHE